MGTIIVSIILLAVVLNAIRVFYKQMKRMKKQNCTGDCKNCKTPCQAKRIYHIDDSGPDKFFLSAIAPVKSERKFWHIIHKIRAGMDFVSYWFFNICAILTIIYVAWIGIHSWAEAYGF